MSQPLTDAPATQLARRLTLPALVAVGVGIVVSQGTLVTSLQATGQGLVPFAWALGIAVIIAFCYVMTFAELALMMPQAGGLSTYTEVALGHFPALLATYSGYILVPICGVAAELILVDSICQRLLPVTLPPMTVAYAALALFTMLNIRGVDVFAAAQNFLSYLKMLGMLGVGLLAIFFAVQYPVQSPATLLYGTGEGVTLTTIAPLVVAVIWGLFGAEYICPMIEEAKAPNRNIPRAMFFTLTAVAVLYAVFATGAALLLPASTLTSSALPHLDYAAALNVPFGLELMAVAAIAATLSLVNGILAAVPRVLYGMAMNRQALPVFGQLHPQYRTPRTAIVALAAAIGALLSLVQSDIQVVTLLLQSAALFWLIAYLVAHADLLVLRVRHPDVARPYRSPWTPLPQVVGIGAMTWLLFNLAPTPEATRIVYGLAGLALLVVAVCSALWVKCSMRRGLFQPDPLVSLPGNS